MKDERSTSTQMNKKQATADNSYNYIHLLSDFSASWMSYACSLFFSHPLDTIRVRWQTKGQPPFTTLQRDGVRSLYYGVLTPLYGNALLVGAIYSSNEAFRSLIIHYREKQHEMMKESSHRAISNTTIAIPYSATSVSMSEEEQSSIYHHQITLTEVGIAAAAAGVTCSILQSPFSTIKIQQQNSGMKGCVPLTGVQVVQQLLECEGIRRGIWRGWGLEAFTNFIGRGGYFCIYEWAKRMLVENYFYDGRNDDRKFHDHDGENNEKTTKTTRGGTRMISQDEVPFIARMFAAVIGSQISWTLIFPLDIVKTRFQGDEILRNPPLHHQHEEGEARAMSLDNHRKNGHNNIAKFGNSFPSSSYLSQQHHHRKKYHSYRHCAIETWKKLGWRGFWTGYWLTTFRSAVVSSISLPVFEVLKPHCRRQFVEWWSLDD